MSYLGSKAGSGAYQKIIGLMPPHDIYIEAFLGSGVVLKNKPYARASYGIDKKLSMLDEYDYTVPNLTLINANAIRFIDDFDYTAGQVFIYADPPYLHSTRTSLARYQYEMTDDEHITLLAILKNVPAKVMISGYPSALYDEHLKGWRSLEFQSMTRGGVRTEKLWFNYEPDSAFWSKYAGKNFTDRQRIKRKAKRWADSYSKLSDSERLAIFAALLETHAEA